MTELSNTELAEETIQWVKDWREGMFTPARTADGWTVEMHGLADSAEKLAEQVVTLLESEAEWQRRGDNSIRYKAALEHARKADKWSHHWECSPQVQPNGCLCGLAEFRAALRAAATEESENLGDQLAHYTQGVVDTQRKLREGGN